MTIIPTWAKVLAIISAIVGLGIACNAFIDHEQSIGYNRRKAEDNVALIAAQNDAAIKTKRLNKEKNDAIDNRIEAEKKLSVASAAVAAADVTLRDARARLRDSMPGATITACRAISAALDTVFGQCAEQLESVARYADQCSADTVMLQQAWPK